MEQPQLIGQAKQFNEKINNIKSQFFSALDDFKKYYVYYNKNPEVNEFQNYYVNSKGQLQNLSRDLFLTTNNIDKNIETLDKSMSSISAQLDDEKKLNKEMMKLIASLENTQNGSEILIDDSKSNYNEQYINNWEIFIGILFVSILLGKLFKNVPSVPVPTK
jgi:midasin (ATPase involved in ribosome maturation)